MSRLALVIFAKAPVAGLAKTRLIPALGAAGAAALAQRMLAHAVAMGIAVGPDRLEVCATPDASHPAFGCLPEAVRLERQGEGDLGQRMHRAFGRVLAQHERMLLIGTDAPALDTAALRQAAGALQEHDAVFVPALDGGYALAGLRSPSAALFEGIGWSTSAVMAQTRDRLRAAGLRWHELPAVADVDEPADLARLPPGWLA